MFFVDVQAARPAHDEQADLRSAQNVAKVFEGSSVQRKRFGRPCAECVDDDVEPDEILARQIEQILDDELCLGIDLRHAAHEPRNFIPARKGFVYEKSPLFACRAHNCYLFHDTAS